MASEEYLNRMQARAQYGNHWHIQLGATTRNPYCCFACWCGPCFSYQLRKRALHYDMSRYTCCAGYMPCSGKCGENQCPYFCLATESQHYIEMESRDHALQPPVMEVPPMQEMSRLDQPVPPVVGYPVHLTYGLQPYPPSQPYPPPPGHP